MSVFRELKVYGKLQELRQSAKNLEISTLNAGKRTRKFFEQMQDDVAVLAEQCASQALILQALMTYLDEKGDVDTKRFAQILTELECADAVAVTDGMPAAGEPTVKLPKP